MKLQHCIDKTIRSLGVVCVLSRWIKTTSAGALSSAVSIALGLIIGNYIDLYKLYMQK